MGWQAVEFSDAAKERIQQAATFEKRLRLESLLDVPTQIGAFKLRQFTLRDMLELEYSENALLDGKLTREDCVLFLWQLRTSDEKRSISRFTKWAIGKLTPALQLEISAFLSAQYNEFPTGDGGVDQYDSNVSAAFLIDFACSEYGWSIERALDSSMIALGQLFQRSLKRHNSKYAIRSGITQQAKATELKKAHG